MSLLNASGVWQQIYYNTLIDFLIDAKRALIHHHFTAIIFIYSNYDMHFDF